MAAGVPAIMRRGFNYGASYPHINNRTGIYSDEENLPTDIVRLINKSSEFSPRDWIIANMTPEVSTAKLNDSLEKISSVNNEAWTKGVAIKISTLDGLKYKDPDNQELFYPDNAFLKKCIKDPSAQ
jgi:hypothetical protein